MSIMGHLANLAGHDEKRKTPEKTCGCCDMEGVSVKVEEADDLLW